MLKIKLFFSLIRFRSEHSIAINPNVFVLVKRWSLFVSAKAQLFSVHFLTLHINCVFFYIFNFFLFWDTWCLRKKSTRGKNQQKKFLNINKIYFCNLLLPSFYTATSTVEKLAHTAEFLLFFLSLTFISNWNRPDFASWIIQCRHFV